MRKKLTIAVWHDHALVPTMQFRTLPPGMTLEQRRAKFWEAYREVRKGRLATGDDSHHWRWLYAHPQLRGNDIAVLVLLYLLQKRMIELTLEGSQFLQQYFQKFRGANKVAWESLFEHMLRNFVLPEDWRTMWLYIKDGFRGKHATAVRQAAEAGREQPVESLEKVERDLAKKRQGYAAKPQRPRLVSSDGHPPQSYAVDDVVSRIREDAKYDQWAPSRSTVYNWITKGHRWYGKIDAIHTLREQPRITDQGLAQIRMIVQAKNRCDKLRNSPGMTANNLKKLYQRYRKPDGTPDLDAVEAHAARLSCKAQVEEPSEDTLSLEEKIAACDELLERLPPQSKEWEDVQEEREQLRQGLSGCHP